MKYLLIFSLFLGYFLMFLPKVTSAHFPATDGDITATLHVDPNDDPSPQQQAHLYFLISDESNKFQLSKCNCQITISEQGNEIYRQKLIEKKDSTPNIWGASMPFIFPQRDVYHIAITGEPLVARNFQPFILSWDFRVDPGNSPGLIKSGPSDIQMIWMVIVGIVAFAVFIGVVIKKGVIDAEK